MRWSTLARAVPIAPGVILRPAGCVQLITWKARRSCLCRFRYEVVAVSMPATATMVASLLFARPALGAA
jgi:hypothetical protein